MAIVRTLVLKCDNCEFGVYSLPDLTDQEMRDVASNKGFQHTKNGTDLCIQCASDLRKEEGE